MEDKLDETKFYDDVPRGPCPFHRFELICEMYKIDAKNCKSQSVMKDCGGYQCALASIINEPCISYCPMEESNWTTCSFNTKENREKIKGNLDKIMVFPKEFQFENKKPYGIPLRIWMRHVIDTYC